MDALTPLPNSAKAETNVETEPNNNNVTTDNVTTNQKEVFAVGEDVACTCANGAVIWCTIVSRGADGTYTVRDKENDVAVVQKDVLQPLGNTFLGQEAAFSGDDNTGPGRFIIWGINGTICFVREVSTSATLDLNKTPSRKMINLVDTIYKLSLLCFCICICVPFWPDMPLFFLINQTITSKICASSD